MRWLALLLCVGCRVPSYVEVSPGYSEGYQDFNRSFGGIDGETTSLVITLGWDLGSRYEASRNIASLRPSIDLGGNRGSVAPITLNVPQGGSQAVSEDAEDGLLDPLKKPAETTEEAIMLLIWVCTMGIALFGASKLGLLDRLLGKKKE